jgi:hypothetical protein
MRRPSSDKERSIRHRCGFRDFLRNSPTRTAPLMRKTDSPPTVWPTPIIIGYAVLFSLNMWISYRSPVFLALSIIGWLFISASLLRVLTTELTNEGVSQSTLRGRIYVAWADVEQVSRSGGRYWVTGKGVTLFLRPGLFEDPGAAWTFIEKRLSAERLSPPEGRVDQFEETTSLWVPGKFTPRPAADVERFWIRYSPLGWEYLPYAALLFPGAFAEYAIFRGHAIIGAAGLMIWVSILWLLLVTLHQAGRMRIWLSVPIVLVSYLAIGLFLVGSF